MHVEKQKAIDGVLRHRAFGTKPKHVARNHFNHLLWRYMQDGIMDFAAKHRCEVRDIEVECDSDMRDTVLAWGMKPAAGAKTYDLADVIAWSNVHGRAINTCKELDIRDKIWRHEARPVKVVPRAHIYTRTAEPPESFNHLDNSSPDAACHTHGLINLSGWSVH